MSPPPIAANKVSRGRQYLEQQQTYPTHLQYEEEYLLHPPLLSRPKTIPLPALTDVPIINPPLSYTPSKVALEYDFSQSLMTARLPRTTRMQVDHRERRKQPASTVRSMTIVVPGVERALVVFPLRWAVMWLRLVKCFWLCTVLRGWVVERHDKFGVEQRVEGEETIRIGDKANEQETGTSQMELKILERTIGGWASVRVNMIGRCGSCARAALCPLFFHLTKGL